MTRRLAISLLVLGVLACTRLPQVEPRHPPVSLLDEPAEELPGLCKANVRAFQPECAALIPYELQPPIVPPRPVKMMAPKLSLAFRTMRITGTAIVDVVIDESGRVCDARVQRGHVSTTAMRAFDESVREALLESRFRPATFGEVPVAVVYRVTYRLDI
ncbi:MAG TPA: TonB family protein [Planctomycetota bacterium]|nr:TonB family protein [Planctomycetota bacterium]